VNVNVLAAGASVILVVATVQFCVAVAIGMTALAVRALR
jgi:hypothetical protein